MGASKGALALPVHPAWLLAPRARPGVPGSSGRPIGTRAAAEQRFELRDGRLMGIRPLAAQDADGLREFASRLSARSLRMRFLGAISARGSSHLDHLAAPASDDNDVFASVSCCDGAIRGIGELVPDTDGGAEFALLIEDAFQGLGIGRLLLQRLVDHARFREFRAVTGFVLADNRPMLAVLQRCGYPVHVYCEGPVTRAVIQLTAVPSTPGVAPPPSAGHRAA